MYELADLEFTSDEDDDCGYEEEEEFDEWETSGEEDDDDGSTSSDEENIVSVEEGVNMETASMGSGSTSSDEEDTTPEKPKTAIGEVYRARELKCSSPTTFFEDGICFLCH